mgnify:FL=1
MKKNQNDNYFTTDNDIILEDGDTGEQMIFFIDKENGLVIRSFMEDEVKYIISRYDNITSSEKRKKRKILNEELMKKESQYNYFVIEKIEGENLKRKRLNTLYGLPRTAIGLGMRYWAGNGQIKPHEEIELYIYEKDKQFTFPAKQSLTKLTQKLGLKGEAYIRA